MSRSRTALVAAAACVTSLAAVPAAAPAATPAQIRDALADGVTYLRTQQGGNGTITGFGGNTAYSALAAGGAHPADVKAGGPSAQDALDTSLLSSSFTAPTNPASDAAGRPGQIERAILEAEAAGIDSSRVGASQNLVAQLAGYSTGGYFAIANQPGGVERRSLNYAAFGTLALARAGAPAFLLAYEVRVLRANQHTNGGWDYPAAFTDADRAAASNADITGATLAALCDAGVPRTDEAVQSGANYLASTVQADGGLNDGGQFSSENVSTNAWAIAGLQRCGIDPQGPKFTGSSGDTIVDFLLSQQNQDGGFFSPFTPGLTSDVYSTQDALRPLGGEDFSATPPTRAIATDSRFRALPTVADGTTVPLALAVDDGAGKVTFCRVSVPSGSSLAALLARANASSAPSGCATGGAFTGGQLSGLNGATGTWSISVDGGGEQIAAEQTVRFGDLVALRRTSSAVPATPAGATAQQPVPAAVQARTTAAATTARSLRFSAKKRVVGVPVSCARANGSCQGTVFIVSGKSTLGRRPFTIAGGRTTTLNVKLYAKQAKKLGGKRRRVKVNVFSRDGQGVASTSSRTVTIQARR